jgi:DNA topoisomerase IB
MGAPFTAKDFRTWGATLRAFALMAHTPLPEPPSARACKACEVAAIKTVAAELRNTPAVCRKSYINPAVFAAWRSGVLHEGLDGDIRRAPRRAEAQVLRFLRADAVATLPRPARAHAQRRASSPRGARFSAASAAP